MLRKLGIECNRTTASRMVLTDRQDITAEDELQNIAETRTGGILVSVPLCGRGVLLFDSEKLTTVCCVGLMIKFNICDK